MKKYKEEKVFLLEKLSQEEYDLLSSKAASLIERCSKRGLKKKDGTFSGGFPLDPGWVELAITDAFSAWVAENGEISGSLFAIYSLRFYLKILRKKDKVEAAALKELRLLHGDFFVTLPAFSYMWRAFRGSPSSTPELKFEMRDALASLSKKERKIINLLRRGETWEGISEKLKISKETISDAKKSAKKLLLAAGF